MLSRTFSFWQLWKVIYFQKKSFSKNFTLKSLYTLESQHFDLSFCASVKKQRKKDQGKKWKWWQINFNFSELRAPGTHCRDVKGCFTFTALPLGYSCICKGFVKRNIVGMSLYSLINVKCKVNTYYKCVCSLSFSTCLPKYSENFLTSCFVYRSNACY